MRIVTVVGARPQFIKAAALTPALSEAGVQEIVVNTGQHYDREMSAAFFEGLGLPEPAYSLQVGSASHGAQTGRMLEALEPVLMQRRPQLVLVYGDTNSTLAGALAAAKLNIPVAHVEAGLRSFDRGMPEEINRVLTDHLSTILFAPTETAVANLAKEGIIEGVVRTGDVMYDLVLAHGPAIETAVDVVLARFKLQRGGFAFVTVHRPENTDDLARWADILEAFRRLATNGLRVVWAAHPRTRASVEGLAIPGLQVVSPLPYLQTQALLRAARVVLTDSGGLQKEAAFNATPCVTLRERTEWVELIDAGVNRLAGTDPDRVVSAVMASTWPIAGMPESLYGDGHTSQAIAAAIRQFLRDTGTAPGKTSATRTSC